ncbi:hypothetical protein KFK09_015401 [Dendrobium nobile]|uniref:Uncharacterized protein n=1 Tax=Dendrobium nobile TaxID=94219 RepID=A0A8T3B6N7_DENNO|nr:hypothetical protein KFK09_015401 [Dendrobium nobile]
MQFLYVSHQLHLSQSSYAESILHQAAMSNCNSIYNASFTKPPTTIPTDSLNFDPNIYHHLTGFLQYLTITRPDLSFTVNTLCQHMHNPTPPHFICYEYFDVSNVLSTWAFQSSAHLYNSHATRMLTGPMTPLLATPPSDVVLSRWTCIEHYIMPRIELFYNM